MTTLKSRSFLKMPSSRVHAMTRNALDGLRRERDREGQRIIDARIRKYEQGFWAHLFGWTIAPEQMRRNLEGGGHSINLWRLWVERYLMEEEQVLIDLLNTTADHVYVGDVYVSTADMAIITHFYASTRDPM